MPEANEGSLSATAQNNQLCVRSGNRADGQLADQIGGSMRVVIEQD
jgi:hypothetical protein